MAKKKGAQQSQPDQDDSRSLEEQISENLDATIIAIPLLNAIEAASKKMGERKGLRERFHVIIDQFSMV